MHYNNFKILIGVFILLILIIVLIVVAVNSNSTPDEPSEDSSCDTDFSHSVTFSGCDKEKDLSHESKSDKLMNVEFSDKKKPFKNYKK